jgi:sodium/potassium-transporting ATPase subunit alpha
VAREAGQIVLLNDDFASIVLGICEGRLIFENLKKCISYVLSSNMPEMFPFVLFVLARIPLGIETIMVLLIDMGTDLAPAISLAYEDEEDQTMKQPPRKRDDHLVGLPIMLISYFSIGVFQVIGCFVAFFLAFRDWGFTFLTLLGAGPGWRTKMIDLTPDRIDFFKDLCTHNAMFLAKGIGCDSTVAQASFWQYRQDALMVAQTTFVMAVVWLQVANVLVRKTSRSSMLNWTRLLSNTALNKAILIELSVIFCCIYIPGLNTVFFMGPITAAQVFYAMWCFPIIIAFDEWRKWLARNNPDSKLAKWLIF